MKTKKIFIPAETNEEGEIIKEESYKDVDINTPTKLVNGKRFILSEEEIAQFEKDRTPSLKNYKKKKRSELKAIRDAYKLAKGYDNERINNNKLWCLNGHTEVDRNKCISFLNNLIEKYDTFKEQINSCTSIGDLDKINIEFNNNN